MNMQQLGEFSDKTLNDCQSILLESNENIAIVCKDGILFDSLVHFRNKFKTQSLWHSTLSFTNKPLNNHVNINCNMVFDPRKWTEFYNIEKLSPSIFPYINNVFMLENALAIRGLSLKDQKAFLLQYKSFATKSASISLEKLFLIKTQRIKRKELIS